MPRKKKPEEPKPELKLIYRDRRHQYWLNCEATQFKSVRAKSVSTIAKVVADDYNIRLWHERMVALGVTIDGNLRENVAMHADNRDMLINLCEDAKKVAQAHVKADRGSQKHRVLELVLTGQEHKLITPQQRQDAAILKRTLDRYHLVPHGDLAEKFIAYPEYVMTGRFDAVLDFELPDGKTVLVDLKSGENAVKYPHATSAQLAMYSNAPRLSLGDVTGDKVEIAEWGTMPERLEKEVAYVLLVENDVKIGELYSIDIVNGWRAAQWAMDLVAWRKQMDRQGMVKLVDDGFTDEIAAATTEDELKAMWYKLRDMWILTDSMKQLIIHRRNEILGISDDTEESEDDNPDGESEGAA